MAEAYYEPTPATDGATMNPVPGAVFQVFEIADTTFSTPLSLRVGAGNPTTSVTASETLATLPGVYVTSPNFEHHWKSGTFVWRRDSIDGAKKAIESSAAAADAARIAASTAGQTAAAEVEADIAARIASGEFKGAKGDPGPSPFKGVLPNGTDINTVRTPGVYSIPTTAAAGTMVNWPTNRAGILEVWSNDGSSMTSQTAIIYVSTTAPSEQYVRSTLVSGNTSWNAWDATGFAKGVVPGSSAAPTNLDTFSSVGAWGVSATTNVTNWPHTSTGVLVNYIIPGTSVRAQTAISDASGVVSWKSRVSRTTSGFGGVAWTTVGASASPTTPSNVDTVMRDSAHRHGILRNHFKARRGGVIGTGGKGVYSIRIDHWLGDFERDLKPALDAHNIPVSIAMNSQNWGVPVTTTGAAAPGTGNNGTVTPAALQDWSLYRGYGVANHSRTHAGTNDPTGIISETIGGQQELQLQLPRLVVDEWHMPGVSSDIAYDGFGNGNRLELWMDKLAGKAILHSHAHASGYMQGFWHELMGEPQIGEMPQGADNRLLADRKADVDQVIRTGKGLVHLIHGNAVASGQLTVADWEEFCAYIAGKRDAGELLILTTAGEAVASSRTNYRAQVVQNPTWGNSFADWTGNTGWTVANPGTSGAVAACTNTAGMLTQAMLIHSRHGWVQGSQVEIVAQVRNTDAAGSQFAFDLYDMSNQANFSVKRSRAVPADGSWVWHRMNVTIPRVGDLTQMRFSLGRDGSGGALEVRNLAFQPI